MEKSATMETKVNIKASAEKFFDVYCNKTHHFGSILPEQIECVEIQKGEWGSEGSIICWYYSLEGKRCVCKEVVEDIDKKNKKMKFRVIEGDLLELYKTFNFILQVTPEEQGSVVHWVIQYDKQNDLVSDPQAMLQLLILESNMLDVHLTMNTN
ncbi:unnamed protein product [Sphenostylis stenocarpa]|nr:unnamed protein product [Sphenostylis stenocarpa]